MGLLSWLTGAQIEQRASYTLANPTDEAFDAFGGTRTTAGERISTTGAMAIADVFSAVNIIAGDVAQCPLRVYRNKGLTPTNPSDEEVEAPEHSKYDLLHTRPNPFTPAHRFWATIAVHELLWGNWFIEKLRDVNGIVSELRICDPSSTSVFWDEATGAKRFQITRQSGQQIMLGEDRVLHGFGVSLNGLIGLSTIAQCREALGVTSARKTFEGEVYGSRPYLAGTLDTEKSLSPKAVANIRQSWRTIYGGPNSERHQIAVLEEGAHFNAFTAPFADMQFVEQSQLTKTEIAVMFKLPPSYLGGSTGDSLTYQTVEGNKIQKATQAIAPLLENIAKFVSGDSAIFPFPSWYCRFVLEGMLRGDSGARADYYAKMFPLQDNDGKRAIEIDEIRELEGRGPATPDAPKPVPPQLVVPDPAADPSAAAAIVRNGNA